VTRRYTYTPTREIITADVTLRRLRDAREHRDQFLELTTQAIGADYDEITPAFARNLTDIDDAGFDRHGYFSLGKEVWVATANTALIGFEVITRKRGGSIKLGPTIIQPAARGKGYAGKIINNLISAYERSGVRKVYVTAPLSNDPTAILDFRDLHLTIEAFLRDHYRPRSIERVAGKLLRFGIPQPLTIAGTRNSQLTFAWREAQPLEPEARHLLATSMPHQYDDIDDEFVDAVEAAIARGLQTTYEQKGKAALLIQEDGQPRGIAICSPKRGGTLKVAPFIFPAELATPTAVRAAVDVLQTFARKHQRRKLFVLLPVTNWQVLRAMLAFGGTFEGALREPYKPGVDVIAIAWHL
jgi:GNAT superfamily N-acetyltransferase